MNLFFIQIAFYIFSVNSTQMYSSDPLYPNDFYLQQDFLIDSEQHIDKSNFNPQCIPSNESNTFKCYRSGTYTLSLDNNREINFQVLEEKRTYRWSFSIFERFSNSVSQESTRFIEQGKNYSLRIWITQLSFNSDIQSELNCTSSSISQNSEKVTLSFYSLGEFPIVSFTEFDEYNIEPVVFVNEKSYWEVDFTVNSAFLRSLTIKGHDNSNIFDVVSQVSFNFQYKSLISKSSQLFSEATQESFANCHIVSINSIPCYPNYAIATVINDDSPSTKRFFFTNDGFTTISEFGSNKGFLDVYLTINGIYYIDNHQRVRKLDSSNDIDVGISFNDDPPIGFFSSSQCDFFRSYGNQISYENRFIGVFSSKKVAFSYDGNFFRDDFLLNKQNLTFLSVAYKWQCLTILALDSMHNTKTIKYINKKLESNEKINDNQNNDEMPFIVNYDLQNHMASRVNLPFMVTHGNVKYGSDYGFFVTGNNFLFSPDSRAVSSIFLPGHFQSNQDTYITSFVQQGNKFVVTTSAGTSYCGNYKNSKANQIFDNSNNGILIFDSQQNVVSVGIDSITNKITTIPIFHYIESTISSYSTVINGEIIPKYLDSGDIAITNLTIATVSKYESSVLIMPPKNTILSYRLYSESLVCSTLTTYINRHIDIHTNVKTSSEFCTAYYISTRAIALSSYQLQSRRGEGGEEGSTRLQIYLYSNGKVIDVYNLPLIFGCSPKRRLGIRMHKKICYPDENDGSCLFSVFYNKFFKPVPLIFDGDKLIGEANFDFALITDSDVKYKMTVSDAKCRRAPQNYEKMGEKWSRNTYESCFFEPSDSNKDDLKNVIDDEYTILNLTHNEVKINKRKTEFVEFKLINLGSSATMCQLEYTFKVKVLERPINPGFIALIVIVGCILVINAMIFEYWQTIMFMYPEAVEMNAIKEERERRRKEEEEERKRIKTETDNSINQTYDSDIGSTSNITVEYDRHNENKFESSNLEINSKTDDDDDDDNDNDNDNKHNNKMKLTNRSEDEDDELNSLLVEKHKEKSNYNKKNIKLKKNKNKKGNKKMKNTNKSELELDDLDNDNDDDDHENSEDEDSSNDYVEKTKQKFKKVKSEEESLDDISDEEQKKKSSEFNGEQIDNKSDEIEEEEEDNESHNTVA